jgi:hypothetical protein
MKLLFAASLLFAVGGNGETHLNPTVILRLDEGGKERMRMRGSVMNGDVEERR